MVIVVVVVMIDSAYYLWMASSSMENPAIHGWSMPLVVENRDEMYGGYDENSCYLWMEGRHPWMAKSTNGMHHKRGAKTTPS